MLSARALAQYRSAMAIIDRKRSVIETRLRRNKRRRLRRVIDKHVEPSVPTPQSREDWLNMVHGRQVDDRL